MHYEPQLIEKYCLPKYIVQGLNLESFIYAPQCPANKRWEDITGKIILGVEEYLIRPRVIKSEITITGFSIGAQGLYFGRLKSFYKMILSSQGS